MPRARPALSAWLLGCSSAVALQIIWGAMHNEIDFGWCDRHPWAVRTFLIVALLLMALVVIRILADSLQPFAQSRVDAAGTSGVYLGAAKMACPQLAFMGYEARVVLGGGEKVYGTACWDLSSGKMIVRPDDQAR